MEAEKAALAGEKQAVELEKSGIQEELIRVEQERMDLDTEKMGLNQTLETNEQMAERLQEEIAILNREKAEITEQLNTVSVINSHVIHVCATINVISLI